MIRKKWDPRISFSSLFFSFISSLLQSSKRKPGTSDWRRGSEHAVGGWRVAWVMAERIRGSSEAAMGLVCGERGAHISKNRHKPRLSAVGVAWCTATPTATSPPPELPPMTEELCHLHRHDGRGELSQRMSGTSFWSASSSWSSPSSMSLPKSRSVLASMNARGGTRARQSGRQWMG